MTGSENRNNKILLTYRDNRLLGLCFDGRRLVRAENVTPDESLLGNICIGRVKQVNTAVNAAFVEFSKGLTCFLPLTEKGDKLLVNREYDGSLRCDDRIVLQISKDASKNKEYSATCNLSVSGRYFVLTLLNRNTGFSSKLSPPEKDALKSMFEASVTYSRVTGEFGIIFRSNSCELIDTGLEEAEKELNYLYGLLDQIKSVYRHRTLYSRLYVPELSYLAFIRDCEGFAYDEVITDDEDVYTSVSIFLDSLSGSMLKARLYRDSLLPLQKLYNVDTCLDRALSKKCYLESGAFLYIESTEALTVIDVNSGKKMYGKKAEDYYLSVNLEAAEEIAHQLRLRNISGIIIIDFINMKDESSTERLVSHLKNCILTDRVKTTFVDVTGLGLVELTRKKEKRTLAEQLG